MIGHHCLSWVRGGGRDYVVVVSGVGSTGAGGTLVDGGCLISQYNGVTYFSSFGLVWTINMPPTLKVLDPYSY